MKVLVINGPNLNLLESRGEKYGGESLDSIKAYTESKLSEYDLTVSWFQSNHEGEIIDKIQGSINKFDLLVINPAGFSHTSVAIRDALELYKGVKMEVHLTNVHKREDFRQKLLTAGAVDFIMKGFGKDVYYLAVLSYLNTRNINV